MINTYGLPLKIDVVGFSVLSDAMTEDAFNVGIDYIITDDELMTSIYSYADMKSEEYEKLAQQYKAEYDIKCPDKQACKSAWEIFCSDFSTCVAVVGEAILALAEFGVQRMLAPFNALGKNLFKNPLGTLLFVGAIAVGAFLFIKIGLPILFPPAAVASAASAVAE